MALVKRVLNPAKKRNVRGSVFSLIIFGIDAVLYDELMDEPIIYGNKNLVKDAVLSPKKLTTLLPESVTNITLFVYKKQDDGEIKKIGEALHGKPTDLKIANY
jgi:hypothetical protein